MNEHTARQDYIVAMSLAELKSDDAVKNTMAYKSGWLDMDELSHKIGIAKKIMSGIKIRGSK